MNVLVVGGDRIEPIKEILVSFGVAKITHWDLRKKNDIHKQLPQNIDCLLLLTNFLNHNAMFKFKSEAKKRNIPFVCADRRENDVFCQFCRFVCKDSNNCPKSIIGLYK